MDKQKMNQMIQASEYIPPANIEGAILYGADFTCANIEGVDFSTAYLECTKPTNKKDKK